MKNSTKWALDNFKSWMGHRNSCSADKCPENLLEEMEPSHLNKWLSIFIAETRKVNEKPYPPTSLHLLLSGLQHYMKSLDKEQAPNIFFKNNPAFTRLHHTMDSLLQKTLSKWSGVGAQKRSTEIFTKEEENQLWESGVLGTDNPTSLLRAVFSTVARSFAYEVNSIGIYNCHSSDGIKMATHTLKTHPRIVQVVLLNFA